MSTDASEIEQRIGGRVLIARNKQGITAKALAAKAGVHTFTLYRVEAGLGSCTIGTIYRIANALNMQMSELLP